MQDGNIAEAVVWECGPAERHTIVNRQAQPINLLHQGSREEFELSHQFGPLSCKLRPHISVAKHNTCWQKQLVRVKQAYA